MILEALDQSRRLATQAADRTRLAVHIPSKLYVRLYQHTGRAGLAQTVVRAIERELERAKVVVPQS